MKIVVFEYFTSGALSDADLSADLAAEGDAMLQAILSDMLTDKAWQPVVLRDQRLPILNTIDPVWITSEVHYRQVWQKLLQDETLFLLIAPETGGVLLDIATAVVRAGKRLVGCQPEAIDVCSDKRRCGDLLAKNGFNIPHNQVASDWLHTPNIVCPVVIKPSDGAGCQQTMLFSQPSAAQTYLTSLPLAVQHQLLVQPYLAGAALSVSLFISHEKMTILSLNQQQLSRHNDQLHYHGSHVGITWPDNFSEVQAQQWIRQLHQIIPGLWGFVGVDLIITDERVWIVDINPRLTTSFNQLPGLDIHPARLLYDSIAVYPEQLPHV